MKKDYISKTLKSSQYINLIKFNKSMWNILNGIALCSYVLCFKSILKERQHLFMANDDTIPYIGIGKSKLIIIQYWPYWHLNTTHEHVRTRVKVCLKNLFKTTNVIFLTGTAVGCFIVDIHSWLPLNRLCSVNLKEYSEKFKFCIVYNILLSFHFSYI